MIGHWKRNPNKYDGKQKFRVKSIIKIVDIFQSTFFGQIVYICQHELVHLLYITVCSREGMIVLVLRAFRPLDQHFPRWANDFKAANYPCFALGLQLIVSFFCSQFSFFLFHHNKSYPQACYQLMAFDIICERLKHISAVLAVKLTHALFAPVLHISLHQLPTNYLDRN